MARRNYFDILGLDFDPAESNKKKIEAAIARWKAVKENELNNATDMGIRQALHDELAMEKDIRDVLSTPKTRNPEAAAMKKEKIALLEQLIDIMSHEQHGTPLVTQGQIRNVATKLRLQPDTVSGVYKKRKFQILLPSTTAILNGAFLTGSDQRTMAGFMDKLKAIKNPNELHKYPWMPKVTNLYELACFYCNEGDDKVGDYRRKRTGELLSIMQRGAMQYASDNSDGGHALADLFGGGSTYVFNSEDNRTRYDNTIELELLESFFRMLKRAPEEFKLDRQFAESCVSIIQKHFPDRDLALALYNREAGLVQTPYEPTDPVIHVTCPSCKADHQFSSRQEAEKAVCSACGTSLYVKCPSCGKLVPGSMIYCSCNFRIAEMRFFNDYYNAAVAALKNMDLAVIYDSKTDNTKQAARWIAEGMGRVEGVNAGIFHVSEAENNAEFIRGASGVVMGCPTYAAIMTPAMRDFLMGAGKLGMAGKLGGAFATVQYTHGGGELVIQSILTLEMCFGMLCYSGGASMGKPVIHLGPVAVNGNVEAHNSLELYRDNFNIYGERFAAKAEELFGNK